MAEKLITIGNDIDGLQKYLHYCHSFLNAFKWLSDSFVLVSLFSTHHYGIPLISLCLHLRHAF